jgi:hypothetical protein
MQMYVWFVLMFNIVRLEIKLMILSHWNNQQEN